MFGLESPSATACRLLKSVTGMSTLRTTCQTPLESRSVKVIAFRSASSRNKDTIALVPLRSGAAPTMRELLAAIDATGGSLLNLCVWAKHNAGMGSFYRSQHVDSTFQVITVFPPRAMVKPLEPRCQQVLTRTTTPTGVHDSSPQVTAYCVPPEQSARRGGARTSSSEDGAPLHPANAGYL